MKIKCLGYAAIAYHMGSHQLRCGPTKTYCLYCIRSRFIYLMRPLIDQIRPTAIPHENHKTSFLFSYQLSLCILHDKAKFTMIEPILNKGERIDGLLHKIFILFKIQICFVFFRCHFTSAFWELKEKVLD